MESLLIALPVQADRPRAYVGYIVLLCNAYLGPYELEHRLTDR